MVRRVLMTMALVGALGPAARAQVKLEYKAVEGATHRHKAASKVDQVLTIAGTEVKTQSSDEAVVTSATGKRKDDGTLPIDVAIESVKLTLGINGQEFAVDSADKDPKVDFPGLDFLGPLVKAFQGVKYTLVLDAKGNLKHIEGVEKNLEKANDLPEAAASALKGRLNVDRIKREFEQRHGTFPDGLVREGEPWERTETMEIGGDQTLTFKKKYEYKGTVTKDGKTLDKIDVKATEVTYKQDPDTKSPAKVTKSNLKVESGEGTLLFDRAAGETVERREKFRITGDMTMTIMGNELPAKLDLTMETNGSNEKVK
jgi:hypothetical protein